VHLTAPGWNVVGATAPWMPGVAIGHNDQIAWGMTAFDADSRPLCRA
jgi:penicillin amidase